MAGPSAQLQLLGRSGVRALRQSEGRSAPLGQASGSCPHIRPKSRVLSDIDGDGKPSSSTAPKGAMRYAKPDPANPTGAWIVRNVSEPGYGDRARRRRRRHQRRWPSRHRQRVRLVGAAAAATTQEPWTYHPQAFGRYRTRERRRQRDGGLRRQRRRLNDVVTSLAAHGWGLAWYEQKRDAGGTISFVQHMIMDDFSTKNAGGVTFSQPHGSTFADVDGDGITDFIVGKRYWSHRDTYLDPDPYGPRCSTGTGRCAIRRRRAAQSSSPS